MGKSMQEPPLLISHFARETCVLIFIKTGTKLKNSDGPYHSENTTLPPS